MQISFKYNFIFIHIPKTGGSSITECLDRYLTEDEKSLSKKFSAHGTAQMIKDKLGEKQYNKMFKFSFVRNPWDAQFSLYNYILRAPFHPNYSRVNQCKNFAEYLETILSQDQQLSQKKYLTSIDSGEIIVDLIGRFENIIPDFQKICSHLNIPQTSLPFINKNPISPQLYFDYYTPELIHLVYKKFQEDIEYFGYKFPLSIQEKRAVEIQTKQRILDSVKYQLLLKKGNTNKY